MRYFGHANGIKKKIFLFLACGNIEVERIKTGAVCLQFAWLFVGFFEDGESELAKTFQKVADAMSTDLKFAHTSSKAVLNKYGFKKWEF